jgi:hypothetical protein
VQLGKVFGFEIKQLLTQKLIALYHSVEICVSHSGVDEDSNFLGCRLVKSYRRFEGSFTLLVSVKRSN